MIIHCTQKFFGELKKKPTERVPPKDAFWSWHANVFIFERRKCVLITNDTTLFTMFIPALTKPDFQSFHFVFGQNLFKNFLYEEIHQNQIESVLSECEDIKYEKTNNRSVLGSINNQIFHLENYIEAEGGLLRTDIYELNKYLNRILFSAINYKCPIEMLKIKLQEITYQDT